MSNALRKLERSVIMHKSYKFCGSTAMFNTLWEKYHYHNNKDAVVKNPIIKNTEQKPKKFRMSILSNIKKYFLFLKRKISEVVINIMAND